MSWINKIFGKKENETATQPRSKGNTTEAPYTYIFTGLEGIRFGRYSDNNKTYHKTQSWYKAEDLFKEKKYNESFFAMFDYLRDDAEDNVHFQQDGNTFKFDLVQGSKKVHGHCDGDNIIASVPLANMEQPATAVMRRLLDLNYTLYYTRTGLDDNNNLCMLFDTPVKSANPNKIYYGLREMATKADRQDDLLLADFGTLKPVGTDHIRPLTQQELEIKYRYFRKWIEDTLKTVEALNQDSFSGAIAYLLLTLIYRIDFLIVPEANLLGDLEKMSNMYWEKKDEIPLVERNQMMKDAAKKLLEMTPENFAKNVYHSTATFAISIPAKMDKVKEHIYNANKDSRWYIDNKYPELALVLNEYGVLYNHFIYSMPRVSTDLTTIYMAVLYADYFRELGMKNLVYDPVMSRFMPDTINQAVKQALARYEDKYTQMKWDNNKIRYDSIYEFGTSFSEQMASLNLETKR